LFLSNFVSTNLNTFPNKKIYIFDLYEFQIFPCSSFGTFPSLLKAHRCSKLSARLLLYPLSLRLLSCLSEGSESHGDLL
jgi:hypothetical protein